MVVLLAASCAAPTLGAKSGKASKVTSGRGKALSVPREPSQRELDRLAPRLDRDPTVERLVGAERRRLDSSQKRAADPRGLKRARESRTAHSDASHAEAAELAQREFPDLAGAPPWEPLKLEDGEKVEEYVNDYTARIDRKNGAGLMAASTLPLRARDERGKLRRVDLDLERDGSAFVPDNPLIEARLPEALDRGIVVDDEGLRITPMLATDAGHIEENRVFYGGGRANIDVLATPAPAGLQITAIVRAAEASEDIALELELPAGASWRIEKSTGMLLIERDGKLLYRVSAPSAIDAAEQPVAAEYRSDGDQPVLHVAHRASQTTYPVAVDPMVAAVDLFRIADKNLGNKTWGTDSFAGWGYASNQGNDLRGYKNVTDPNTWGLAVVSTPGRYYANGAYGEWLYPTPSNDVYIERVDFAYVDHVTNGSCLLEGIFNTPALRWDPGTSFRSNGSPEPSPVVDCSPSLSGNYRAHCAGNHNRPPEFAGDPGRADCVPDGGTSDHHGAGGNWAVIGLYMNFNAVRNATHAIAMYGSVVWMYDDYDPAISTMHHAYQLPGGALTYGQPPGWIDRAALYDSAVIQDRGLGPIALGVYQDGALFGASVRGCPPNTKPSRCFLGAWQSGNVVYDSLSLAEGVRSMSARGIDAVARYSPEAKWQVKVDRTNPSAALGGPLFAEAGAEAGDKHKLTIDLDDAKPGNPSLETSGVRSYKVTVAGRTIADKDLGCSATVQCQKKPATIELEFDTKDMELGTHEAEVVVRDGAGHSATVKRSFKLVDTRKPKLVVSGGLRSSPLATGPRADLTASDGASGLDTLELERRSLSSSGAPVGAYERVAFVDHCPTNMGCPKDDKSLSYALAANTPTGRYEFRATAKDRVGNASVDEWRVQIVQLRSGSRGKLGLEQWFELDDTPAGGDTNTYVNGENGNLVWHGTPIVNPGRGLSSVVNLTYNSQERGGLLGLDLGRLPIVALGDVDDILGQDLIGTSYKQAGTGFSISVSGPTRVNEPLGGILVAGTVERATTAGSPWPGVETPGGLLDGRVTMTDADGTAHVFTRPVGSTAWRAPAGVNMRLSYVGARGVDALLPPSIAALESEPFWQLLRPDGVKHIFDRYGYLQKTEDRNGNVLDYVYEGVKPIVGGSCSVEDPVGKLIGQLLDGLGLCVPRLKEVRSPSWKQDDPSTHSRRISFTYTEPGLIDSVLSTVALPLPNELGLGWLSGAAPQIKTITDQAGRRYDFEYCPDNKAYLCKFTENAGGAQVEGQGEPQRATRFDYEEPPGLALGDVKQLKEIKPLVAGQDPPATKIAYHPPEQGQELLRPAPRKVAQITKRNGAPKHYRYQENAAKKVERFFVHEQSDGDRHLTRETTLDGEGRPESVIERATDRQGASEAFTPVPSQGSTTTNLTWNATENKVGKLVEAAGKPDERTTDYEYATTDSPSNTASGALTRRTVKAKGKTREWSFEYADAVEGGFVADPKKITGPGGRAWEFFVEPATGNERWRRGPDAIKLETDYDQHGQIVREVDAMGRLTTIPSANYHPTGQPQTVTLPADAGQAPRTWRYRYDDVGNIRQVLDPRAPAGAVEGAGGLFARDTPYTTSLDYDGFDRLVKERIPRCVRTTGSDPCKTANAAEADYDGPAFVERSRGFDRNGNVVRVTDEQGASTEITPDAMDQTKLVKQPKSSGDALTDYVYDDASRLVGKFEPMGHAGADLAGARNSARAMCEGGALAGQRHLTRWCLDHRGLPLAEVSTSLRVGDPAALIKSSVYDGRGNQIAQRDPLRNSTPDPAAPKDDSKRRPVTPAAAITAVSQPGGGRTETEYDLLDRAVVERERPTESGAAVRERRTDYDEEDDVTKVTVEDADADRVTTMDHDTMGRVRSSTDPEGRMTCYRRQADGLVTHETSPRGTAADKARCASGDPYTTFTTRMRYDALGDLVERSVPYAPDQYGPDRPDVRSWKVQYKRDVVGNPEEITDASGNTISNDFYASGALRSSTRPSWWELQWEGEENPPAGDQYAGSDAADMQMAAGGPRLEERSGAVDPADGSADKPPSLGKGDLGTPEQADMPQWLPRAGKVRLRYDATDRLSTVLDAEGRESRIGYDPAGRVMRKSMPFSGSNRILHTFGYDADDNLKTVTQERGADVSGAELPAIETGFDYDGYDRRIEETTDGANAVGPNLPAVDEKTGFAYGPNGTVTERVTPRGTRFSFGYDSLDQLVSEANPEAELWRYAYNRHGERTEEIAPGARDASRPDDLYTATLGYDKAGQLTSVKRPVDIHAGGDEVQRRVLQTTFGYDDDGNRERTEAPGSPERVVSTVEHDGRGLPWRTTVRRASASVGEKSQRRVSINEHDANGNLRREVRPAGVDQDTRLPRAVDSGSDASANLETASRGATVHVYSADDLKIRERLPWDAKRDQSANVVDDSDGRYERRFERADNSDGRIGRLTGVTMPYAVGADTVLRTTYEYNDAGWITKTSDTKRVPRIGAPDDQTTAFTYAYDEQGNQLRWRSKNYSRNDRGRELRFDWWPNGQMQRRSAVKPLTDGTESKRTYEYTYNLNRSLAKVIDQDADRVADGKQRRVTMFERDGAERELSVDERFDAGEGTPVSKRFGDSRYVYDTYTGDLARRDSDGVLSGGEITGASKKSTSFRYDALGREYRMSVVEAGKDARETHTRWNDSGTMAWRRKPNRTRDVWKWNALGEKTEHQRIRQTPSVDPDGDGSDPSPVSYDYDPNGNRTSDERGKHGFNARDQLVWWKHAAGRGANPGALTTYDLDGSGAMKRKVDTGPTGSAMTETDFMYDGDRLEETKTVDGTGATAATSTQTYRYDDSGNVQRIYTQTSGPVTLPKPGKTALSPDECKADDLTLGSSRTVRYCYDEFNRQTFASGSGIDKPTFVTYDGLDRRDSKQTKQAGQDSELRDYSYLGSTELVTSERYSRGLVIKENKSHTYDYDSQGDRTGQATNAGSAFKAYAKDANGSVTGLEDNDGTIAANERYDYDPYGELDREPSATGDLDEGLSQEAKDNPFRFQGFYYDSGVKSYDMHARAYRPEVGRFLSQDIYASASGDQALQADPLTQNRYAFAGANPVTNVEFDGHHHCGICYVPPLFRKAGFRYHKPSKRIPGRKRTIGQQEQALAKRDVRVKAVNGLGLQRQDRKRALADMRENPAVAQALLKRLTPPPAPKKEDKCGWGPLRVLPDAVCDGAKSALKATWDFVKPDTSSLLGIVGSVCKACKGLTKAISAGKRALSGGGARRSATKAGRGGASARRTAARSCSFGGATTVLMANGRRKPIEDVMVGDKVIATDPETGEHVPKRVGHVWVHDDTVVDLVVDGDVITTTEDHPFWSVTDQRFERADQLAEGEVLLGPAGRSVTVSGLRPRTARTSLAYNLSVEGIQTYHVGDGAVLVHNSCDSSLDALNDPKALDGLNPSQIDDLARNAGFEVLPGKASAANPATRYYVPGTNRSEGFRVLPGGVAGQSGTKGGAYLRYFGGRLHGQRVPLGMP